MTKLSFSPQRGYLVSLLKACSRKYGEMSASELLHALWYVPGDGLRLEAICERARLCRGISGPGMEGKGGRSRIAATQKSDSFDWRSGRIRSSACGKSNSIGTQFVE